VLPQLLAKIVEEIAMRSPKQWLNCSQSPIYA
jgi:hypothetical protein